MTITQLVHQLVTAQNPQASALRFALPLPHLPRERLSQTGFPSKDDMYFTGTYNSCQFGLLRHLVFILSHPKAPWLHVFPAGVYHSGQELLSTGGHPGLRYLVESTRYAVTICHIVTVLQYRYNTSVLPPLLLLDSTTDGIVD